MDADSQVAARDRGGFRGRRPLGPYVGLPLRDRGPTAGRARSGTVHERAGDHAATVLSRDRVRLRLWCRSACAVVAYRPCAGTIQNRAAHVV